MSTLQELSCCGVMRWPLVAFLLAASGFCDDASAPAPPDLATLIASAADIKPTGRPNGYKLGQPARYYIWNDSDGWHLRTTAPRGRTVGIRGTLRMHDAKLLAVRPIGIDKQVDLADVSPDKTQLAFKFTTSKSFDGFDFNLEAGNNSQIEFELFVSGKQHADRIFIGSKAANPKSHHFALPAKP